MGYGLYEIDPGRFQIIGRTVCTGNALPVAAGRALLIRMGFLTMAELPGGKQRVFRIYLEIALWPCSFVESGLSGFSKNNHYRVF